LHSEYRYFLPEEASPIQDRMFDIVCRNLGVSREAVLDNLDSLKEFVKNFPDVSELIMELEEEFG
jgi:acyl carrier protein